MKTVMTYLASLEVTFYKGKHQHDFKNSPNNMMRVLQYFLQYVSLVTLGGKFQHSFHGMRNDRY